MFNIVRSWNKKYIQNYIEFYIKTDLKKPIGNEVLVRHKAVGVNYIDIYYRNGMYPLASLPGKLGHEASGLVEEIGENVTSFKVVCRHATIDRIRLPFGKRG